MVRRSRFTINNLDVREPTLFQLLHPFLIAVLLVEGPAQAAALPDGAREHCVTEISMFCAGRKDVAACLRQQQVDLTARCRIALDGGSPAQAAARVSAPRDAEKPRTAAPPAGAVPVSGAGNIWFMDDYSGPRPGLYPKFRNAVSAEVPRALEEVAKLLGQSGYRAGFPRPLILQVEYDPTQMKGLGSLNVAGEGLGVTFNMAHWEDCPSQPILRGLVAHEFSHAMLHDLVGEGRMTYVPQWFDEGLATLAGGEPEHSIFLEAAYYRHGRGYPASLACRLDNVGPGLQGGGLLTDCYPYYLLAVRHIAESSPDALPKVISDLSAGIPMEQSISARVGLSWSAFDKAVEERVRRTFKRMSPLSRLTGRNWWRHVRWCRG